MKPSSVRVSAVIAAAAVSWWLAAEGSAVAQSSAPLGRQERRWRFVVDERPSVRYDDLLRVDVIALVDFEWRDASDGTADAEFDRRRIGVEGRLFEVLAFEVERDLGDNDDPWRDVFVEFRRYRAVRVRGGQFKIPFGAERLTSVRELEFARRSTVTETLTPDRDIGVEVSGRLFDDALAYATGLFTHDGSAASENEEDNRHGDPTVAARLIATPFVRAAVGPLRHLETAIGYTHGGLTDGLHSPVLRTSRGYEALAPMYVSGVRQRLGVDANLVRGKFALRGEYLRLWDQRRGQGLTGEDLPDLVADGGYLSAAWMALGDLRDGGRAPRTPLFRGGVGAVQVAARVETIRYRSDAAWDDPFRNPRAANVLPNDLHSWTLGVNWQPIRYLKLQFNVIREHLADPERRPDLARPWSTSRVFRVQFSM